jgi:hypothetical protein
MEMHMRFLQLCPGYPRFYLVKNLHWYCALSLGLFLCASSLSAQQSITWDQLTDVKFTKKYAAEFGIELLEASFGPSLKALDGKQVIIKGYIIPLDPLGTQYVISRNPMASCFFCGGSGPETVAELRLHPKSIRRYATDEILTFKGTLMLNENNAESLNYVILNAERL